MHFQPSVSFLLEAVRRPFPIWLGQVVCSEEANPRLVPQAKLIVTMSLVGLLRARCFTRFSSYECKSGFAEFVISILHQDLQRSENQEGYRTICRYGLLCGSESSVFI